MIRSTTAMLAALLPLAAAAHEGHGLAGTHWHASDALGFALVLALGAAAFWLGRGK